MVTALKDLLASKKFLVLLAAIIVAIASKLGLNLDPDMLTQIIALAGAYIVGQGIADHGKEAAKINAAANDNAALEAPAAPAAPAAPGAATTVAV
jgi:hypothetical protein